MRRVENSTARRSDSSIETERNETIRLEKAAATEEEC